MHGRSRDGGLPGYDRPVHRDRLFVVVLVVCLVGGAVRVAQGDPWWQAAASVAGGVFLLGVLLGSGRAFLRGWRELGAGAGD